MGAPYCPEIDVDLSRVDVDLTIESGPQFDVEVIQQDLIIEAQTLANQGPKGDQGPPGAPSTVPGPVGPNPSLTIAAFAERAAAHILEKDRP